MLRIKDPGSSITHFIGFVLASFAGIPLLIKAAAEQNRLYLLSFSVFIVSMMLLYLASTVYHTFDLSQKINRRLQKMDHMMIFILIAGSYTPVCLLVLGGRAGRMMFLVVWGLALVGMLLKAFWITCPKWFSSVIYIGMGWTCVFAFSQIYHSLSRAAFLWILAGGIIYTVGGIIYALRVPAFDARHKYFGSHEIFHVFVMAGSACHFIAMFLLA